MEKYFIANWKMNNSFQELEDWLDEFYENCNNITTNNNLPTIVLCPPSTLLDQLDSELVDDGYEFLSYVAKENNRSNNDFTAEEIIQYVYKSRPIKIGAQDCHYQEKGSYTSNISAKMLKDVNCEFVILGHSERRVLQSETNQIVSLKAENVLKNNMIPIICIGEELKLRQENTYLDFIGKQLIESLPSQINNDQMIIVAYEPVWAIGSGQSATVEQISEVVKYIHKIISNLQPSLKFYITYGGSVDSNNAEQISAIENLSGLLVGRASLDAGEFLKIVQLSINN